MQMQWSTRIYREILIRLKVCAVRQLCIKWWKRYIMSWGRMQMM